jgi:hypothetical protein
MGIYAPLLLLPNSAPNLYYTCYAYPDPAVQQAPTIRGFFGQVDSMDVTVFDVSGRQVRSTSVSGAPTGIANGNYYYDAPLDGAMASGTYYFVAHGKGGSQTYRCRGKFAVVR